MGTVAMADFGSMHMTLSTSVIMVPKLGYISMVISMDLLLGCPLTIPKLRR